MNNRHRHNRPADFDMSFLVPGLPFFEDMGQGLSDTIQRLFGHLAHGFARLVHHARSRDQRIRHDLEPSNAAAAALRPAANSPEAAKN